jgi:thiamine-monophosphate kinase
MLGVRVSDVGEFGLIELLQKELGVSAPGITVPNGDDCAAWQASGTALATTDTMVEDVHFRFRTITWDELGWKALAVNVSDIASMGGSSDYALLTLGLSDSVNVPDLLAMARSLAACGREFSTAVVGGDIVSSPRAFFLTVALYGHVADDGLGQPMTRSAARVGDQVAITGWLGRSAAGYRVLNETVAGPAAALAELRRAHNRPWPRLREGQALRAAGVRACVDVSDGLVADLGHIAEMSGLGIRLRVESLPLSPDVRRVWPADALHLALSGGEEYELAFTASATVMARAVAAVERLRTPVTVVGEVVAEHPGKVVLLWQDGREETAGKGGFDHFRG